MARKSSKGRQKVPMMKMQNETNLQVTFSKRRGGIFKKASELCTMCGVEIAIIVFSPGKKVFSFGHPSLETLLDRFEGRVRHFPLNSNTLQIVETYQKTTLCELNTNLTRVLGFVENEKKRWVELDLFLEASRTQNWWERLVKDIEINKLDSLKTSLKGLKSILAIEARKMMTVAQNPANNNFFVGSSSSSAAAAGPSDLQGFVTPDLNNDGFSFYENDHVMQAPGATGLSTLQSLVNHDVLPNNLGFNDNPNPMPVNSWSSNLGGSFL